MNATTTLPERPARHEGLVVPAIMIGLGIVLLLNSLGLLGWDVLEDDRTALAAVADRRRRGTDARPRAQRWRRCWWWLCCWACWRGPYRHLARG